MFRKRPKKLLQDVLENGNFDLWLPRYVAKSRPKMLHKTQKITFFRATMPASIRAAMLTPRAFIANPPTPASPIAAIILPR